MIDFNCVDELFLKGALMRKKVLLTGASGEVGFEAFKELTRRKDRYSLRLFLLRGKKEERIFKKYGDGVEIVWGDLRDFEAVKKAVKGVDVILHVAGIIPPLADENPNLAREVNVGGTRNLVTAAMNEDVLPKFVFTSSVSVYGDRIDAPEIRIDDAICPSVGDDYARTKIEAENLIRESGLAYTIFRLCGILTSSLKIQPLMFHMPLATTLEWCFAADAGFALVEAIECEEVFGRTFNLGGGERCTVRADQFLKKMFDLFGLSARTIPRHAFAIRNFHSGFYADGDVLNDLLHFRRRVLSDYYETMEKKISGVQRFFTGLVPIGLVRKFLEGQSEPWRALKEKNMAMIERYYGGLEEALRYSEKHMI